MATTPRTDRFNEDGCRGQGPALGQPRQSLILLCLVSFGFLPNRTQRALARTRPSVVRLRIRWRSNSASPPRTVSINRPCGVVVSAQGSPSDLKLAPASPIVARVLSKSLVERAKRSSFVTSTTSLGSREARHRDNAALSVLVPDCFSL